MYVICNNNVIHSGEHFFYNLTNQGQRGDADIQD
jgi:hypothetical protein